MVFVKDDTENRHRKDRVTQYRSVPNGKGSIDF